MRSLLHRSCLVAGLALLLGAVDASAAPVLWTLQNIDFADGSVATGSFIFDADTVQYSSVNISLTAGTMNPAATFNFLSPVAQIPTVIYMTNTSPVVAGSSLGLFLSFLPSQLTDAGGTVGAGGILGPCLTSCGNVGTPSTITLSQDSSVVGVAVSPEPDALTLFGLGSLLLFALKRWQLRSAR
jgi:hypothetical protein